MSGVPGSTHFATQEARPSSVRVSSVARIRVWFNSLDFTQGIFPPNIPRLPRGGVPPANVSTTSPSLTVAHSELLACFPAQVGLLWLEGTFMRSSVALGNR